MNWKSLSRQFHASLKAMLPQRHVGWTGWPDGSLINPNRPNYIRVVMQDNSEVEAWNDGVPAAANMQVDLYTDPDYPGLLRARQPRLSFTQDFPYICVQFHRDNHTWPGPDVVAVEMRQFMPLHPSVNGFVLTVRAGWLETTTGLVYFNPSTIDLTANKPASGARYVLISISETGTLTVTNGAVKTTLFALESSDIPALPAGHTRVCAVRLFAGQAAVRDQAVNTDLLDQRFTGFGMDGLTADWGSITNIPAPVLALTGTNTGDQDLSGLQPLDADLTAIAALTPANDDIIQRKAGAWVSRTMAELAADLPIDSGATLPTSPQANDLFMHTPTGRRVLMIYTNSAWTPLYSFDTVTLYVDGTLGTDSANNGGAVGAGAYKTLSYMWTQLPSIFYGNITANVAAGTYAETLTCQDKTAGGAFGITIIGAQSVIDSGTATGGVQGATSTLGTLEDTTKAWTINEHKGRLALIGSAYRVIQSNTANTLTVVGYWSSSPSGSTYSIITQGTTITGAGANSLLLGDFQTVKIQDIKFTGATQREIAIQNTGLQSFLYLERCWINSTALGGIFVLLPSKVQTDYCYLSAENASVLVNIQTCQYSMRGCYYYRSVGTRQAGGIFASLLANVYTLSSVLNYFENLETGMSLIQSHYDNVTASYLFITNCATGIAASFGGTARRTTNHVYASNTTDENATAASFGYID